MKNFLIDILADFVIYIILCIAFLSFILQLWIVFAITMLILLIYLLKK